MLFGYCSGNIKKSFNLHFIITFSFISVYKLRSFSRSSHTFHFEMATGEHKFYELLFQWKMTKKLLAGNLTNSMAKWWKIVFATEINDGRSNKLNAMQSVKILAKIVGSVLQFAGWQYNKMKNHEFSTKELKYSFEAKRCFFYTLLYHKATSIKRVERKYCVWECCIKWNLMTIKKCLGTILTLFTLL